MAVAGGECETKERADFTHCGGCDRRSSRHRVEAKRVRGRLKPRERKRNRERCLVVKEEGQSQEERRGRRRIII